MGPAAGTEGLTGAPCSDTALAARDQTLEAQAERRPEGPSVPSPEVRGLGREACKGVTGLMDNDDGHPDVATYHGTAVRGGLRGLPKEQQVDEVAAYQCGSPKVEAPQVRLHIGGASKETPECSVCHPLNKEPDNVTVGASTSDGTQCIGSGGRSLLTVGCQVVNEVACDTEAGLAVEFEEQLAGEVLARNSSTPPQFTDRPGLSMLEDAEGEMTGIDRHVNSRREITAQSLVQATTQQRATLTLKSKAKLSIEELELKARDLLKLLRAPSHKDTPGWKGPAQVTDLSQAEHGTVGTSWPVAR